MVNIFILGSYVALTSFKVRRSATKEILIRPLALLKTDDDGTFQNNIDTPWMILIHVI